MDTNKLKKFATEARVALIHGVEQRISALGFKSDGSVEEEPILRDGGATFMGDVVSTDFYQKWKSSLNAIQTKSVKEVAEEAAYTWFNRLVAIRILAKNNIIPPLLKYEADGIRIPLIVTEARHGRLPEMDEESRERISELLADDSRTNDQFRILITAFCHSNPILDKCFGRISDYTELLLPQNILAEGGFVDMLNNTGFIEDADFRSPELIGWLYQFYISERKDEVFAKKGKVEEDEIPAATQIFTPNWIVKYMVQNTVGRIYLDNNPDSADEFRQKWAYLVESSEPTPENAIYRYDDLSELKVADLACGSGHILNECFDLLLDLYESEGYLPKDAITKIFNYNLVGVDIDTRAKQLATFALLLKACQKDRSFEDAHCMPKIYDMPAAYDDKDELGAALPQFMVGGNDEAIKELTAAIELMDQAHTLGSIMKFKISERTRNIIATRVSEYDQQSDNSEVVQKLMPYMRIILALTENYSAIVMNPPYMGSGNMNEVLSNYVKKNYPDGKSDLCTVFMMMQAKNVAPNGYYANIIPPSWMFLSSFEELRKSIIDNNVIYSLLHLSRGVFGADFGSVSTVIQNRKDANAKGTYFRLIERTFQEFDQKHLKLLFERTLANHDFRYYFADYTKDVTDIVYSDNGAKTYYPNVSQQNFEKIPGCPIGYWLSDAILDTFDKASLKECVQAVKGLDTCDNTTFVRYWCEVSQKNMFTNCEDTSQTYNAKWYPYCKGGYYRKWGGLNEMIVNWENNGEILRNLRDENGKIKSRPQNIRFYFKEGITWNSLTSGSPSMRYMNHCIFGGGGSGMFSESNILPVLGFLNSKAASYYLKIINPTINILVGDMLSLPVLFEDDFCLDSVFQNISISKQDWNAHETSWDFEKNELVALHETSESLTLGETVKQYENKWKELFMQLHANEEELNRQFIEIYGLEDELSPDVPLNEISILQQGEISIENGEIVWHNDVIIKQLISYAVGCMMGRYSIDKSGLILANQGDGTDEYNELVPNSRFAPDDDGIIPLMSDNPEFSDNASARFKHWLTVTFGSENLNENLNFVEECLGKSIDEYFVKDFWNDHKKMYQNRPIYWLFSSKKGAFQCLTYMHRMDAYTAERIRTKYLLPHIEWLKTKQSEMQAKAADLSSRERKELDSITKQIDECLEYHNRLHVVADNQIAFDLDDGVVVNYAKFGDVLSKIK